jgi:3-isopropylmalate dehydratase small subunit
MEGLDEIGLTLRYDDDIVRYEASRDVWLPTA